MSVNPRILCPGPQMLTEMEAIVNLDVLAKIDGIAERKMMKIKALVINRFSRLSDGTRSAMGEFLTLLI